MSDAYEDDLAAELETMDRIEAANRAADTPAPPAPIPGRPHCVEPIRLVAWRQAHNASIAETARRWSVSSATVKRLCRDYGAAAEAERSRWQCERLDRDLAQHCDDLTRMFLGQRSRYLNLIDGLHWFGKVERAKGTEHEATTMAERDAALAEAERQFREDWERSVGPLPDHIARL